MWTKTITWTNASGGTVIDNGLRVLGRKHKSGYGWLVEKFDSISDAKEWVDETK